MGREHRVTLERSRSGGRQATCGFHNSLARVVFCVSGWSWDQKVPAAKKGIRVSGLFFEEAFPSSLDAMGGAIDHALAALREGDWIEEEDAFYARLCLEEALVNAIVHGNRSDAECSVRIEMHDEGECCRIRVLDEGSGFDVEDIRLPDCRQVNGRGICLIRYCMEKVTYEAAENCLEMTMRRKSLCKGGVGP